MVAIHRHCVAAIGIVQASLLGQVVTESAEPNSFPSFTLFACGQQGDGLIQSAQDIDYWRVQFAGPTTLRAAVGPGSVAPRIADTRIELRDAGNTLIAENDDAAGIGLYSELRDIRVPSAGIYYVVVKGYAANTGSYSLDVSCGPPGPPWSYTIEAAEPNATNSTATPATCWNRFDGAVVFAADVDRFAFPASVGQMVTITTGPGNSGSAISDTVLTVRNGAGLSLAYNDDALGLYSRVTFIPPATGTYYADVAGYLSQVVGTYTLEFDCSGIQQAPASMTTSGTGCLSSFGTVPRIQRRTNSSGLTYVERPLIGTLMVGDMTQCPPFSPIFIGAGFQEQNPPIDLGVIGAPGCYALIVASLFDLVVAGPSGTANWYLSVPFNQAFVGAIVEYQGLVFDPIANPLGLVTSNRLRAIVGNSF
jgi:hypothetical protein